MTRVFSFCRFRIGYNTYHDAWTSIIDKILFCFIKKRNTHEKLADFLQKDELIVRNGLREFAKSMSHFQNTCKDCSKNRKRSCWDTKQSLIEEYIQRKGKWFHQLVDASHFFTFFRKIDFEVLMVSFSSKLLIQLHESLSINVIIHEVQLYAE